MGHQTSETITIRRSIALFALFLSWAAAAPAQKLSDEEMKQGFVSLSDLKKWTGDDKWRMDGDGFTVGITTIETVKKDYKDYIFRLEWKCLKDAKAGVGLRGAKAEKLVVNIGDYADNGSGGVGTGKPTKKLDKPVGEWNNLEVRVTANKATVSLNGETVAKDVALAGAPASSSVALIPKGPMFFRNLRIKEVK